jgi:OmpA-OmpF porin, OOP family
MKSGTSLGRVTRHASAPSWPARSIVGLLLAAICGCGPVLSPPSKQRSARPPVVVPATPASNHRAVEPGKAPHGDRDRDGVPDAEDFCATEAEDHDRCDDEDGCPDADNDRDGTPDSGDRCPNEDGPAENHGCPLPPKPGMVVVEASDDGCMILNPVPFAEHQAALGSEAKGVVQRTVECLDQHRQIILLEIRGNSGPDERPPDLAERRARAVHDALIASGVDQRRLRAKGAPPRAGAAARGKRRAAAPEQREVEFIILRAMTCDGGGD